MSFVFPAYCSAIVRTDDPDTPAPSYKPAVVSSDGQFVWVGEAMGTVDSAFSWAHAHRREHYGPPDRATVFSALEALVEKAKHCGNVHAVLGSDEYNAAKKLLLRR